MGAERWDEQVGSVADEAARLLESIRRAAEAPAHDTGTPPSDDDAAPRGDHDPFCAWCPLCRGAAVVRSLSPETLTRLSDLASVAAGVLADLAQRSTPAAEPPAPPRPRGTQSVPVRNADGGDDG